MKISASIKTVLVLLSLILSCKSDDATPKAYLEATVIDQISSENIRDYWGQNPQALPFIRYNVSVVRITYLTEDLAGNKIEASGAILIPEGVTSPRVISLQHATFFADEEAPSENGAFSVVSRKSILAANGAIVILPDYLGYGVSKDQGHPYHHAESLSRHSLDMLNASLAYLKDKAIPHQEGITLAGYSEGAYATLALARRIEAEQSPIEISHISLGSGGYNLLESFNYFYGLLDDPTGCLPCNGFLIYSYWSLSGRERPIADYFQSPYAERIENGLFDGGFNSQQINEALPEKMRSLFAPDFLQRVANGQEAKILGLLGQNSLHNYFPNVPMLITHGTTDTVAPFFNSENYAERAKGLERNIEFVPLAGVNHFDGIYFWGIHTMNWLNN